MACIELLWEVTLALCTARLWGGTHYKEARHFSLDLNGTCRRSRADTAGNSGADVFTCGLMVSGGFATPPAASRHAPESS